MLKTGIFESEWPDLAELQRLLADRQTSSVELVSICLERIAAIDSMVHAILAVDDAALAMAREADQRRQGVGVPLGPLDGIPVLVKDNIDTAGLASTAGSRLLAVCPPARDAEIVTRLRAAGAIVVGKTNLSEWANLRSTKGIEGWSAVGGQTRNPYLLDHSPWGSSAGSAVAVATGMAPLAIGTETDGSVVCPAAVNGVVGVKPEWGLLPLGGIVPASTALDTVGVLAKHVRDAAACLDVLAGDRPRVERVPIAGLRLGRWPLPELSAEAERVTDEACERLQAEGAVVVPIELHIGRELVDDGLTALIGEFRPSLESYLRSRGGTPATLTELIAANRVDPVELSLFGQDLFERAAGVSDVDRMVARVLRERGRRRAGALIDDVLAKYQLDAVLSSTCTPAWPLDSDLEKVRIGSSSTLAALAGYPNISIPAGFAGELPLGVSVFGPARTGPAVALAEAVEQACGQRRPPSLTVPAGQAALL